MTELPAQGLLLEAIAILDQLGLRYMIMGGFAVRTWGVPRPTYDGDLAVEVHEAQLPTLIAALERAGFGIPDEHHHGFLDRIGPLYKIKATRLVGGHVWETDLFMATEGLLATALERRCERSLESKPVWVISAEDLILLKLVAHRRKDLADIEEILMVTLSVDLDYLRRTAKQLGLEQRLASLLPKA